MQTEIHVDAGDRIEVESRPHIKRYLAKFGRGSGSVEVSLCRTDAEALYFALSASLFDGDLSAKPLPERDPTKPADLDAPQDADDGTIQIEEAPSPVAPAVEPLKTMYERAVKLTHARGRA